MKQYIDKAAVVAKIRHLQLCTMDEHMNYYSSKAKTEYDILDELFLYLDSLEVKEVEDLQGVEKEVADNWISRLDSKRIPITLKGELKGKFINEFNTLWQTVGKLQFANVAKAIIERMCLHFAAWGSYNLRDYIKINAEESSKLDTLEVKEVDLEKEIDNYIDTKEVWEIQEAPLTSIENAAKHFFELGLMAKK